MSSAEAAALTEGAVFLAEGGLETALVYNYGRELKEFASFTMLLNKQDSDLLTEIHKSYADVAIKHGLSILLDIETWRASSKWYAKVGVSEEDQAKIPLLALNKAREIAEYTSEKSDGKSSVIINGVIGPRSDAYIADDTLDAAGAREYHRPQILALKNAGVGLIGAYTLNSIAEGMGIALAAKEAGIPCIVVFTLTVPRKLMSGESLQDAITKIDTETGSSVLFFGINCTHPRYLYSTLSRAKGEEWLKRIGTVRGNASLMSHEELDKSTELDEGDPVEFAREMVALREVLPSLKVIGGCCGTDSVHCGEIAKLIEKTV